MGEGLTARCFASEIVAARVSSLDGVAVVERGQVARIIEELKRAPDDDKGAAA